MKSFIRFVEEREDWDFMKKPKKELTAVDDYGREIKTPTLPKKEPKDPPKLTNFDALDPDREPVGVINKNWKRLQDAPPGTEDRAEYKMRKEYQPRGEINMLPRRVGPPTNPEREQYDTHIKKYDTQDDMPSINADEPKAKIRKRT